MKLYKLNEYQNKTRISRSEYLGFKYIYHKNLKIEPLFFFKFLTKTNRKRNNHIFSIVVVNSKVYLCQYYHNKITSLKKCPYLLLNRILEKEYHYCQRKIALLKNNEINNLTKNKTIIFKK